MRCCFFLLLLLGGCGASARNRGDLGVIASSAKHLEVPVYPHSSIIAQHQGVVVVEVELDNTGRVVTATTLQSPDSAIAASALAAAKASTFFMPSLEGEKYTMSGKLFLYFLLRPTPHVEVPTLK